jgi:hypothetical protein
MASTKAPPPKPAPPPAAPATVDRHPDVLAAMPPGTLTRMLRELCGKVDPGTGKTYGELVCRSVIRGARRGRGAALRILWDRLEGPIGRPADSSLRAERGAVTRAPDDGER